MKEFTLQARKRDVIGKKTRFLRRQGITPAHLFGHGLESLSLQCDTTELQRLIAQAGTTRLITLEIEGTKQPRSVFVREIQSNACTGALLHVDLYQVRMRERMKSDVPIALVGEAPALKEKSHTLVRGVTSLSVECLPDKLPPQIQVDLSRLETAEQAIYVKDLVLDPDVVVTTAPDQLVVKVGAVHVEREEEVAVEAKAEVPAEEVTE